MRQLFAILGSMVSSVLYMPMAYAGETVMGNWADFGVQNPDTVISLDCQELVINANTLLFYADFRNKFVVEADLKLKTRVTEQAFICKEGPKGAMEGDLTIGFDPEEEKIFAEVRDEEGVLHRIKAGDKIVMGKWQHVKVQSMRDVKSGNSTLTLTVTPEECSSSAESVSYKGNALPYRVGRWVVGHGYPGGFPNSLQVRNGEIRNLEISGEGLDRVPGQNPLFTDRFTADPACTVVGDRLYAYVGEDMAAPGGWFNMPHWVAYSTSDMKNWVCLFYHDGSYMIDGQPGGDCRRRVCVEELKFNPDGSIIPITLTEEGISNQLN